jgi:hypothetical protein
MYDNKWIVPYNPFLIRRYQAHVNVEICTAVQAIKYIHKHIYKGRDKATLEIVETDEIRRYLTCRYLGPSQAVWSLLEFPTHEEYPPPAGTILLSYSSSVIYLSRLCCHPVLG